MPVYLSHLGQLLDGESLQIGNNVSLEWSDVGVGTINMFHSPGAGSMNFLHFIDLS